MQDNDTAAATAQAEDVNITAADAIETSSNADAAVATDDATIAQTEAQPQEDEEITYHAVQKDGSVTAIWEMQGRKHLRTIDPRSREGAEILRLFTEEEGEEQTA